MNDLTSIKETGAPVNVATPLPDGQTVTEVTHWTDKLFSFRLTRPQSLRFRSGEFVMIGLPGDNGRPILRAYSIASPSWDEELEFYSIAVPDGPLTSKLVHIKPGDQVILKTKPTGTLVVDALLPGKRLYMIATGTGIAPFASLIRDPEVYEKFEQVILTHTCREVAELEYGRKLIESLIDDPLIGEMVDGKLVYYPTTTREDSPKMGRITDKIRSGELFADIGAPAWTRDDDRVMICGSMGLNLEIKELCEAAGMEEGANSKPGHFVLEKSFVGESTIL
ncbi:ferredoxin--NADP reductase [Oricola thermophila]|uniref:ferredoxin--NADP(+) reductase n=1 Tax=Oricola thermophila TaxID=2742145 RepID=A0A6N1VD36_9HYPH|nr:ferredoxin--NADP reductase [Oricola thermophila]QKV18836.1 ferredoxin--NADP reductase [Oricola thermophila]